MRCGGRELTPTSSGSTESPLVPRGQGRKVALPRHSRAATAPPDEGRQEEASPEGLSGAEPPAGRRGEGNVLAKMPESCLKLHFHHREMMGPFPSRPLLIGFV